MENKVKQPIPTIVICSLNVLLGNAVRPNRYTKNETAVKIPKVIAWEIMKTNITAICVVYIITPLTIFKNF